MTVELFTMSIPESGLAEVLSERAEAGGWDGISFTDSQNLVADPFVAIALGARATERLQFMTGVTNPATRHPAALATIAATVHESSGGRMVLGIGRGDTALFHLGRPPMPLGDFFAAPRSCTPICNAAPWSSTAFRAACAGSTERSRGPCRSMSRRRARR